jgi:nucleotide-binding universal stress UspA family protein
MWPAQPRKPRDQPVARRSPGTPGQVLVIVNAHDARSAAVTHAARLADESCSALTVVLVVPALTMVAAFTPQHLDPGFYDDYVFDALTDLVPVLDQCGVPWSLCTVRSYATAEIAELARERDATTVVVPSPHRHWHLTRRRVARTMNRLSRRYGVHVVVVDY